MSNSWQLIPRDPITDDDEIERLYELTEPHKRRELAQPQEPQENCASVIGKRKQPALVRCDSDRGLPGKLA